MYVCLIRVYKPESLLLRPGLHTYIKAMELSPRHSDDWEDEEEGEPLFADDVVNSDEEDPPPLPPPMPSLSQLPQHHPATPHGVRGARGGGGGVGDWGDAQGTPATGK